jgi:hypothetical protein
MLKNRWSPRCALLNRDLRRCPLVQAGSFLPVRTSSLNPMFFPVPHNAATVGSPPNPAGHPTAFEPRRPLPVLGQAFRLPLRGPPPRRDGRRRDALLPRRVARRFVSSIDQFLGLPPAPRPSTLQASRGSHHSASLLSSSILFSPSTLSISVLKILSTSSGVGLSRSRRSSSRLNCKTTLPRFGALRSICA